MYTTVKVRARTWGEAGGANGWSQVDSDVTLLYQYLRAPPSFMVACRGWVCDRGQVVDRVRVVGIHDRFWGLGFRV